MALTSYNEIAKDVLMTANPVEGEGGRLFLDGVMLQSKISDAIAEAIYVGEIFRDGLNVTARYALGAKPLDSVRVPLETAFPSSSRTVSVGARQGTPGNDGIINTDAALMCADDEFIVVLNQINDQQILFPELAEKATKIPLRDAARRIASFAESIVEDRSASTLAEILAYNIYRNLNGAENTNQIDVSAEYAYSDLLGELNTKLSAGDEITNAHTYGTEGRCIIGRPGFINHAFTSKSGIILNGSDLSQRMLRDYNFDGRVEDRNFFGNAYRGSAMQFAFVEASDYVWSRAEKYLGLTAGALKNVVAIAVSREATAVSTNLDYGVKLVDATETRGLKAQPLNCWGHEAFRLSQIITNTTFNDDFTTAGFTADKRVYPVAPSKVDAKVNSVLLPIYDAAGKIVGYSTVANVPQPNGGVNKNGLCTVSVSLLDGGAAATGATVEITNEGMTGVATESANGVYTFAIGQGTPATAKFTKGGKSATVTLTAKQSAKSTYKTTATLA